MNKKNEESNFLLNLNLYSSGTDALLEKIDIFGSKKKSLVSIFTPNPEQVVLAHRDQSFAEVLCRGNYLVPDGIGLVLASRLFSLVGKTSQTVQRIPGVDLVAKILYQAKEEKARVMVIGGVSYNNLAYKGWQIRECSPTISEKSVQNADASTLWWSPAYDSVSTATKAEHTAVMNCIQKVKPTVLFVAFGAPAQEKWVDEHRAELEKAGVRLVMVVGGAFDMLLGKVQRAPVWVRKLGFEWLFRLVQQPWRWRRQLKLLEFTRLVIQSLV